ncbi:methyltransferase [Pseudoalteromonas sp. OOF1S-7]|uniref:methyltransferase n=1 Tax=Pseudoalteromonas sp. OOF1S-7 TaxID=2917757 RepID=UPI001EF6EE0C|nr:methyltransferase [Pseudoalteromonas sp. OOF1S-7]MCG7534599.1 methyltransferase domain-containing protein [Pseudoalteromonas sp. OOF1S-7]
MESVQALNKINRIAFSFYTAGTFAAASNLKVFEHLAKPGLRPTELSEKVNIHPQAAQYLLSALESLELVEQADGVYSNSKFGQYLHSQSEVPMSFAQHDYYFYRMWENLPDALREFSPRHEQTWGKSASDLYKSIYGDEEKLRDFFKLLDSYNVPIGRLAAERIDFSKYNKILDLAGGTGSFSAEVVKHYENLSGVVLDLEPVRMLSEELIERNELQGRFEFTVGDMFNGEYPQGVDVIFLSYILHNWDDEKCVELLKHCYNNLPENGILVISEKVLNNDHSGDWWGVMMSLQMLIAFEPGAKERTLEEYQDLLQQAGFKHSELVQLDAPRDLLIIYKSI